MDPGKQVPTVVAVTGATGIIYARRLLEVLPAPTYLVMTEHGKEIADLEIDIGSAGLKALATKVFHDQDVGASISSGSGPSRRMVVIPCSMNTLAKMASGISDSLVTRSASVCLKQDWGLVIVPRETPLSLIHIENMTRLKRAGAVILPACPGFYFLPAKIEDLVDFIVARVLGSLGLWEMASRISGSWKGFEGD